PAWNGGGRAMLERAGPGSSGDRLPITTTSSRFLAIASATWGMAKSGPPPPAAVMQPSVSLAYAPPPISAQRSATANGLMPLLPRGSLRLVALLAAQAAIWDFVLLS